MLSGSTKNIWRGSKNCEDCTFILWNLITRMRSAIGTFFIVFLHMHTLTHTSIQISLRSRFHIRSTVARCVFLPALHDTGRLGIVLSCRCRLSWRRTTHNGSRTGDRSIHDSEVLIYTWFCQERSKADASLQFVCELPISTQFKSIKPIIQ